MLMAVNVFVCT